MRKLFQTQKVIKHKKIFYCYENEGQIGHNMNSSNVDYPEASIINKPNINSSPSTSASNTSTETNNPKLQQLKNSPYNNFIKNSESNLELDNSLSFIGKKKKLIFQNSKNVNNTSEIYKNEFQNFEDITINKEEGEQNSIILEENEEESEIIKSIENYCKTKERLSKMIDPIDPIDSKYGRWSRNEHIKFIEGYIEYGKNWKAVQKCIGTRTSSQTRSHAQKFFLKIKNILELNYTNDFWKKGIKGITELINFLKGKEEFLKNGKKFITNTILNMTEDPSSKIRLTKRNQSNEKESGVLFSLHKEIKPNFTHENEIIKKEDFNNNNNNNIQINNLIEINNEDELLKNGNDDKDIFYTQINKKYNMVEVKNNENISDYTDLSHENNLKLNFKQDFYQNKSEFLNLNSEFYC